MLLNQDGSINAYGNVDHYPTEVPNFIIQSGHFRWQYNGSGDVNVQTNWTEIPPTELIEEIDIP